MKHARKMTFAAAVIFVICISSGAQARTLPDTPKLVPPETVFLVNIGNFQQLRTQFEKTNLYKLYNDPAMAVFVQALKAKLQEKIRQTNNEIAKAIIDADVLPQGKVAFALVLNKKAIDANEPTALFITQWGTNAPKIKEAVEKTVKKAIEDGSHQKTEDFRGVTIKTIIGKDSSRLGYGFSGNLSYCFIGDSLIGSEDIEVLKFTIAHITGATSPTLADDTDYTAAIGSVGPYHDVDFYINIKHIIKTIITQDTIGKTRTTITNLGLDNITSLGCSTAFGRRPGSSCSGKTLLKINGAKKGICKMLEAESAVLRAPKFIPASVYSITLCNLNIKKAYNELYNILYSFNPTAAAMMHTPLLPPSPDGQPPLMLKNDIIDHLGSQIALAQSIDKQASGSTTPTESLIALAVSNRNALEKSLSLLHSKFAFNNPDAKRQLLGHTIYLIDFSALPFFTPGMTPMRDHAAGAPVRSTSCDVLQNTATPKTPIMAFTITNTHLIFGIEATVEQAIRTLSSGPAVSLDSAKWFTTAKSTIPTVVGLACLQNNVASGEFFWRIMKESGKTNTSNTPLAPNPALMFSQIGLNFTLLPQFDAVRKYFGLSIFYGISKPDGFFFEFNYLNPSGTD